MAQRHMPTPRPRMQPIPVAANQLIPYFNQATGQLEYMTPATLAARQRDRKFRRFWLGFGLTAGLAFITLVIVGGWLLWTVVGLGALAVPVVLGLGGLTALTGHRCVTIVQHMH